jgi:hypothetical protein
MRPECEQAVRAAAGANGAKMTKADFDAIESRILGAMRSLRREDPDKWVQMSTADRARAAADLARKQHISDVARKNANAATRLAIKARQDARFAAVKPGKNGQVSAMLAHYFMRADAKGGDTGLDADQHATFNSYWRHLAGEHALVMQDPTKQAALYREIMGEHAGDDVAARTAKAVAAQMKALGTAQHDAGILGALLDHYTPQARAWERMGDMDEWINKQMERQDLGEYVRDDGSQKSPAEIRESMAAMFKTLATNGANKLDDARAAGGSRDAHRIIRYKDGKSLMAEMQDYGHGANLYEITKQHFLRASRDLAVVRREGVAADADVLARLKAAKAADLLAAKSAKDKKAIERQAVKFEALWGALRRGGTAPGSAAWANALQLVRSVMASTMLGGSNVFGDYAMAKVHLNALGLNTKHFLGDFGKGFNPSKENRFRISQMGSFLEGMGHSSARFSEDEFGQGATIAQFLSNGVYHAMGLHAWDRAIANGTGNVVFRTLGEWLHKWPEKISDLDEGSRQYLQRKGITQDHWNVWRMAELDHGPNGRDPMLTPDAIEAIPDGRLQDLARASLGKDATDAAVAKAARQLKDSAQVKLMSTLYTDMHNAGRGFSGRSIDDQYNQGLMQHPAGTLLGELLRTFYMIRSVPFAIFKTHMVDAPRMFNSRAAAWKYRAKFVAGTTLLAGLGIQLKQLAYGNDPEDVTSWQFWASALAAGGGFGIFGDAMFRPNSDHTDNALGKLTLGPAFSAGSDLWNLIAAAREKPEKFGDPTWQGQVLKFVRNNAMPFARLWYVRAAFDHLVYQQIMEMVNPGYKRRVRRAMQKHQEPAWWEVGDTAPQRAPNLGAAVGQPAQ